MIFSSLSNRTVVLLVLIICVSWTSGAEKPDYNPESSFIGACSQATRESRAFNPFAVHAELMDSMSTANIRFTRTGFKWKNIHPNQNKWDWRITDAVVKSARDKDIELLALISGMPPWVMESPEASIDLWLEFVDSLTIRYKDDISHWEIWNEPNLPSGKYWPQNALPNQFADYVIQASKIIRRNQSNSTILLGGLATGRKAKPFEMWEALFELGVLDGVDGIAYHTYQYPGLELIDFNKKLSDLVAKYTSQKMEYWITEFGVPAVDSQKFKKFKYQNQRKMILESILIHWATGGSKFFIYNLWDKKEFNPGFTNKELRKNKSGYFGLLNKDMSAKPSYAAVRWLAPLLNEYEPLELENKPDGVLIRAKHKTSGNTVFFSWGANAQKELLKSKDELSKFETFETQINLDRASSRTLRAHTDEVQFWH